MLKLPDAARRLPTLANNCYLVGEAKRADIIWTEGDFLALCEHMLNDNPPEHFLSVWIDKESREPQFKKPSFRYRADKRARWAWATVTGKATVQTAIGFYPSNADKKSRWAAIDFDAHNGEFDQARKWSLEAFQLLLRQPQLYLILCASGKGYHLFIYTRELHPIGRWIPLLKQVCEWIGAPIADGSCEIFPNERAESQPCGRAIRAPGVWNPKNNTFSLIEAETVGPLLEMVPRTWSSGVGKVTNALPRNSSALSLHESTGNYSFTQWSSSTRPVVEKILARYPIAQKGTRHGVLVQLVGHLSKKFGREAAQRIVEEHYRLNEENIRSALDVHLRDFTAAWGGMRKKLVSELSDAEKQAFDRLKTEHQREGFLIVHAFAGAAEHKKEKDFPISQASLADRLSITRPGAGDVIRKLCESVIAPTQGYVRQKQPARYRWLLSQSEPKAQLPLAAGPLRAGCQRKKRLP
jgi:hypothetical protein